MKKEEKSNGEVDNLPQEISNQKSSTSANRKRKYKSLIDSLFEANPSANTPSENFESNMNHHNDQDTDSGNVVKTSDKKQEGLEVVNEIQPDPVGSEVAKKKFVKKKWHR